MSYFSHTRTVTYSVAMALPLFVLYEGLVRVTVGPVGIRVGADVWTKQVLERVGVNGTWPLLLAVAVLAVGLVALERRTRGPVPIRPAYLAGMVAESAVYAVVAGAVVAQVVGALFAQAGAQGVGLAQQLALSLGAGLYEELVFRVLLVGGLALLLRRVWPDRPGGSRPAQSPAPATRASAVGPQGAVEASLAAMERMARGEGASSSTGLSPAGASPRVFSKAYVVAALVGALVFSAVHYVGVYGDPFALPSFTFRFLLGLVLNGLYLWRGFGIAAWTHALYDVFVTLLNA